MTKNLRATLTVVTVVVGSFQGVFNDQITGQC